MRKLTIAEKREKELRFAIEKYGFTYDDGKHLMNRFYRLNADLDRLLYLENDERTCNRRSTKELSDSTDRRSKKLSADFEKYGLCLDYFGHLATICEKGNTRTAIEAFYYE